jgi:diguanylate cyclase (GGDEF)-like protein
MQFDIRTLLVSVALATAFCTAARFVLCRLHPALPGLRHWAWGGVFGTLGLVLVAGRGMLPDQLALSPPQLLLAAGFIVGWDGFRRFSGQTPLTRRVLILFGLAALVPPVIAHWAHMMVIELAANAVLIALVSTLVARDLLRVGPEGGLTMRLIGLLSAANAAVFLLRLLSLLRGAPMVASLQQNSLAISLILLWWLFVTIAVTLGMVLMTSERLQRDLDQQVSRDPLTGAFNRRAFALLAEKEEARSRRNGQTLAVLMMDLDHFKQINDCLGHAGGDAMLCRFVAVADRVLRGEDVFCRYGGEEFLALLSDSSADQALAVAERLRLGYAEEAGAAAAELGKPLPFAFTVSLGVSALRQDETLESAIRRADHALYRAKAAGRNRSEFAAA